MKLADEQVKKYQTLVAEFTRMGRQAQLAKLRLEAFEVEIHVNVPAGQRYDIWGDAELKATKDCKPAPGAENG